VKNFLSLLSDQRLLDAAGAADDLARNGNEGGQIVASVAGDAIADELDERKGWWS
jgi:hypothetical protein